jgi:hypothetical protein
MGSSYSGEAYYWWSRACGFHRGQMPQHCCRNPPACQRVLEKAEDAHRSEL